MTRTSTTGTKSISTEPNSGGKYRLQEQQKKLQQQAKTQVREKSGINPALAKFILFSTLALAIIVFSIKLIVDHTGAELARAGHSENTRIRNIAIANDIVSVPENMIRFSSQRKAHSTEKLDLFMLFPAMVGYSDKNRELFVSNQINKNILFVNLAPRFSNLDMSERLGPIYEKFMANQSKSIKHNLVSRALDPDRGFIDEYMIIEKNAPKPFVARCVRDIGVNGQPYCIRDLHLGDSLSLTYRFHADLIPRWQEIEQSLKNLFNTG